MFSGTDISRRDRSAVAMALVALAFAVACGGSARSDDDPSGGVEPVGGGAASGGTPDGGTSGGGTGAATVSGGAPGGGASNGGSSASGGMSSGATGSGTPGDGGAPSGGATGGDAPGGGATAGGGVAGTTGGVPTGGTVPTGGASPTGGATQSSCPASAPTDGEACADDQICFYDDCPGNGLTRAGCFESLWYVRTTPCCPDTPPTEDDSCPEVEEYYYCTYDDCPGGNFSRFSCAAGVWGLNSHQCCPEEPPGPDPIVCGPDETGMGTGYQYTCTWQDCASYGVALGTCNRDGSMTTTMSTCQAFTCGLDLECDAGQVCIDATRTGWVGGVHLCIDNPCPVGAIDLKCARESICPTAAGVNRSTGIHVSCRL